MNKEEKMFETKHSLALTKYLEGNFDECLSILESLHHEQTLFHELLLLERAQIHSGLGHSDKALTLLKEYINDYNLWFNDSIINYKEFEPLKDSSSFQKLIKQSVRNKIKHYQGSHERFHFITEHKKGNKVIFMLHGNGFFDLQKEMTDFISDLTVEMKNLPDTTLCLLLSSKIGVYGLPNWYNYLDGAKEVNLLIEELCNKYSVNKEDTILAGYSAGGGVLFEGAINGIFDIKKIGLTMPHLTMLDNYKNQFSTLKSNQFKFFIHTGDKDYLHPLSLSFNQLLTDSEVDHTMFIEKGRGHLVVKGIHKLFLHFLDYLL